MNHVQTKSTVKKTWRFSTGKGKVCHWVQSGTSSNCFSSLLPPSVNSPRFNIILPSASWVCRWMLYKNFSTPTCLFYVQSVCTSSYSWGHTIKLYFISLSQQNWANWIN